MKKSKIKYYFITLLAWTMLIILLSFFELHQIQEETDNIAKTEALANFHKDQAIRNWAALHGGIYVPIDSITQPNPALAHISERDIETPSGKKLTLMNPAYMIRQLNEYFDENYGIVGHITSKKLIRPENKPDEWEFEALTQFENGVEVISNYSEINGKPYLRYIQPMMIKESCLKCHAFQGYKVGDIRGGVAVSIPMEQIFKRANSQKKRNALILSIIWFIGALGLTIGYIKLNNSLQKQIQADINIKMQNKEYTSLNEEYRTQNSELQLSKEIIAQSEQQYKYLIKNQGEGLIIVDLNEKITFANPAGEELFGLPNNELIGKNLSYFFDVEQLSLIKAQTTKRKQNLASKYELILARSDGQKRYIFVTATPQLDENGKTTGSLGIFRDITDQKIIEQEIQKQNTELKKLNTTKDKFFSIIAHDLKSPFNALLGLSEILINNFDNFDTQQKKEFITDIYNSAENTHKLLENLLLWSISQRGQLKFNPKKGNLFSLTEESIHSLPQLAEHKLIKLNNEINKDIYVDADKNMLSTIIRNLISNAIKFTPREGKISISAYMITNKNQQNFIEITVSDNGIGISKENKDQLFAIEKNSSTEGTEG
ncbi:MAG: DUF3365 domain-containing protein, partial [Bacteroidales bacterium]|nr:DUF3365 domain-containing protein [Bacteroidales bacterium]